MAQAKEAPQKPVTPQDAPQSWGPYREYQFVTTEYGEFGVPAGHIMHLEPHRVYQVKEQQWIDTVRPVVTPVKMTEPEE